MRVPFAWWIVAAGAIQLLILIASAVVPFKLEWRSALASLPKLHRQLYWVYGGYVVLSIVALGLICLFHAEALASGTPLARSFCGYAAVFWGVRLALQGVLEVKPLLTHPLWRLGYHALTLAFLYLTAVFAYGALAVG